MIDADQARALREEVRGHLLKTLDKHRPDSTGLGILRRGLEHLGLRLDDADLLAHLKYLTDKGLLSHRDRMAWWQLTPLGIDILEGSVPRPAGVPSLEVLSPAETERRRTIRWRILTILDVTRTSGSLGSTVQACLGDVDFVVSDKELNREMAYLHAKDLVQLHGDTEALNWSATLTLAGVDLVDYDQLTVPPGLDRPLCWWEDR